MSKPIQLDAERMLAIAELTDAKAVDAALDAYRDELLPIVAERRLVRASAGKRKAGATLAEWAQVVRATSPETIARVREGLAALAGNPDRSAAWREVGRTGLNALREMHGPFWAEAGEAWAQALARAVQ